PIPHKIHNKI
ncbi:lipopolysaccharide biosynthesis protein, partial [Helicobacter pylori]